MGTFLQVAPNNPRTYAGRKRPRVRLGEPGDDGKIMTKNRLNTHRILNVYFLWGLGAVALGVIAAAAAFFQRSTIVGPWYRPEVARFRDSIPLCCSVSKRCMPSFQGPYSLEVIFLALPGSMMKAFSPLQENGRPSICASQSDGRPSLSARSTWLIQFR